MGFYKLLERYKVSDKEAFKEKNYCRISNNLIMWEYFFITLLSITAWYADLKYLIAIIILYIFMIILNVYYRGYIMNIIYNYFNKAGSCGKSMKAMINPLFGIPLLLIGLRIA